MATHRRWLPLLGHSLITQVDGGESESQEERKAGHSQHSPASQEWNAIGKLREPGLRWNTRSAVGAPSLSRIYQPALPPGKSKFHSGFLLKWLYFDLSRKPCLFPFSDFVSLTLFRPAKGDFELLVLLPLPPEG